MNQIPESGRHNHEPDQHYDDLVTDFTRTLDLNAGLADATQPGHYSAIANDLSHLLDLNTGLAAILTPEETSTSPPSAGTPVVTGDISESNSYAVRLTSLLSSLDPETRLHLRTNPHYTELLEAIQLAHDPDSALNHARDLTRDLTRDLNHARDLAHNLTRDLESYLLHDVDVDQDRGCLRDHELVRDLALDLNSSFDRAHARGYALIRALTRAFPYANTRALITAYAHVSDLVRYLAHDFNSSVVRGLVPKIALDLDLDLDSALTVALDRARALGRALGVVAALDNELTRCRANTRNGDRDRAHAHVQNRALALAENLHLNLDLTNTVNPGPENLARLLMMLKDAAVDFTSADLRVVSLAGIPLEGIRWSSATLWPPEWEKQIRAESIEVDDDTFVIRGGGHQDAHITV
jgi:hypothetical protein